MVRRKPLLARVSFLLMVVQAFELIYPTRAHALTSGPTQPEVQSFEPVGTTDMVDLSTGDFVYNIPLLDVDGYPINISYHGGAGVEQEASWVGLGWNINPGVTNRMIRGLPDDFNGDNIERTLKIKPEKNLRVGLGGSIEIFGVGRKTHLGIDLTAGIFINSSNYRGLSAGFKFGPQLDIIGPVSSGVNMGVGFGNTLSVGSQTGASLDYNTSISFTTSKNLSRDFSAGAGLNASGGYNTRTGIKDVAVGVNVNFRRVLSRSYELNLDKMNRYGPGIDVNETVGAAHYGVTGSIPIGTENYVPVITNETSLKAFSAGVNLGGEIFGTFDHIYAELFMSKLSYEPDGSKNGFGYLYLQNATPTDILDFSRDKDGTFNEDMNNLPTTALTYDVYSFSGQGSGGIFRPVRNDYGFVYDPYIGGHHDTYTGEMELGGGELVEFGLDFDYYTTDLYSGYWGDATRDFKKNQLESVFENVYFKKAGEFTESSLSNYTAINGESPLPVNQYTSGQLPATKINSSVNRDPRGELVTMQRADEASLKDFTNSTLELENYTDIHGLRNGPNVAKTNIPRFGTGTVRKKDQISELIHLNKDGSRYVYGLPAMNTVQREVSFSVEEGSGTNINTADGTVDYPAGDDTYGNNKGQENYYSSTVTPAYANSYLLTDVLSSDYSDVTGDGPTDDDFGKYVKFNYSLKENDYRWRTPYKSGQAQYVAGFNTDKKDDRANYLIGSRESWYLHSIETKNYVAEFYTSKRKDAIGSVDPVLPTGSEYTQGAYATFEFDNPADSAFSYKLDSIVLYTKQDRFLNQGAAKPIKTVIFEYNYLLCPGTPNSTSTTQGKLTLSKIFTRYGTSDKNLLSPYQFSYEGSNPSYNIAAKDKWGYYKPNDPTTPNCEFPYASQDSATVHQFADAWQLTKIKLPSGGEINVSYEPDDYSFVQDKRVMEMYHCEGVGSTPNYSPNYQDLYANQRNPFLYLYFKRKNNEYSSDVYKSYLDTSKPVYYNFAVDIIGKGKFEQVRGYAKVLSMGYCSDGIHGYVKIQPKEPEGFIEPASLSPITYTGLNMARYYLPHLFYPGSDPDESDLQNIVKGLGYSLTSLFSVLQNPLVRYVKHHQASHYDNSRSFIRLQIPNLKKYGGGSRVKRITISDEWSNMAGSDKTTNIYGNDYDYTTIDPTYGHISSGVATYEPMAGGDENPLHNLAGYYSVTKGKAFPPNDPTELFQEDPLGETFYPPATVIYGKITVHSVHVDKARSTQTEDVYENYTAKDFPIRIETTEIQKDIHDQHGFFNSHVGIVATQNFSIIMNDIPGKPKQTTSYVLKPGGKKDLITQQKYTYNTDANGNLSNHVSALSFNPSSGKFETSTKLIGEDIDVVGDTRAKEENTNVLNIQGNLNSFLIGIFYIPIPTAFWFNTNHDRWFRSFTTTKIVQQYAILKSVETTKENAKYIVENQVFDPETGAVLLTKENNEYRDAEYSMTTPAYWSVRGMGPAYRNIGIEDSIQMLPVASNSTTDGSVGSGSIKLLFEILSSHPENYELGDELLIRYTFDFNDYLLKAYVVEFTSTNRPVISFKYPLSVGASLASNTVSSGHHAYCKIMRSGYRNMLNAPMQTSTSLVNPIQSGQLSFAPQKAIHTEMWTYSDYQTQLLRGHTNGHFDTCLYVFGYKGNYRQQLNKVYLKNRQYSTNNNRINGYFNVDTAAFIPDPIFSNTGLGKYHAPYAIDSPHVWQIYFDQAMGSWAAVSSTGGVYDSWGNQVEDYTFLKQPTLYHGYSSTEEVQYNSARFNYNNSLPEFVATNVMHNHAFHESFENYNTLRTGYNSEQSPFYGMLNYSTSTAFSPYKFFNLSNSNITITDVASHTGSYSLLVNNSSGIDVNLSIDTVNGITTQKYHFKEAEDLISAYTKGYVVRIWAKASPSPSALDSFHVRSYQASGHMLINVDFRPISNIIDGWQLYEAFIPVYDYNTANWYFTTILDLTGVEKIGLHLPAGWYYDDLRVVPMESKSKAFVYDPFTRRLMASLDENDLATFYEYDPEGRLVRKNKETDHGIITIQESRSSIVKPE